MDREFSDRFWETVCEFEGVLRLVVAAAAGFTVLLLLVFPSLEPGTASYVIFLLDIAIAVPLFVLLGFLIYRCSRFESAEQF